MTEHLEMTPDLAQRFLYALPYIANAVEDYWRNDDKEDELRDLLLEIRAVAIICTKE